MAVLPPIAGKVVEVVGRPDAHLSPVDMTGANHLYQAWILEGVE